MSRHAASLGRLCGEVLGLTLAMGALIVIAAYHTFGGFTGAPAHAALVFSLAALSASAVPILLYIILRLRALTVENALLFDAATRDGLTSVLNRTTFKSSVESELQTLGRRAGDGQPYTLLIVDADHFKRINDRLGHPIGDQALMAIAATLRRSVRRDDIVGRIGGEEFGILLRHAGFDEAMVVAERLRLAIHALSVGTLQHQEQLSVSMGGVTFAKPLPYDTLYRSADANLYRAKKSGRNRVDLVNLVPLEPRQEGDNTGATRTLTRIAPTPRPRGRWGSA